MQNFVDLAKSRTFNKAENIPFMMLQIPGESICKKFWKPQVSPQWALPNILDNIDVRFFSSPFRGDLWTDYESNYKI